MPGEAREAKPDAIICTGRSDYTNQVNNVLCFPFLFRGALDVGATAITEEMKLACVEAIADLARREVTAEVASVYTDEHLEFGPDYLIPKPFDPRLITELPLAVAKKACEQGVAARPITDWDAYAQKLQSYTYRTSMVMRPVFSSAKADPKRIVYCEGEEERVLRAVQAVLDDGIAKPILIGRKEVVETRIKRLGLRMKVGKDFELIDPEYDHRYREYWTAYHEIMERRGVNQAVARTVLRTDFTVIGALMVRKGDADAMICGTVGQYKNHLKNVSDIIGLKPGVETPAAMNAVIVSKGNFFICDTQINPNPSETQIAEVALLAAEEVARFGIKPKVALLSHSNFGTHDDESAVKMRNALRIIRDRAPDLEVDGEMHADDALSAALRQNSMPNSTLHGDANLLIMPNLDAANIAFNMLKVLGDGITIGPILLGVAMPAHILSPSVTPRGILNMTAFACAHAQTYQASSKPIDLSQQRAQKAHKQTT
jgi:malate dehydrogenase (oxaloacetate-decarboxylating)(NADP+)